MPAPQGDDDEEQIVLVSSQLPDTIEEALEQDPIVVQNSSNGNGEEQLKDKELRPMILYLKDGTLPDDPTLSKRVAAESTVYTIHNNVLYYVGSKQMETVHVIVPQQLREKVMQDHHDGHFSGPRLYKSLDKCW